MITLIVIAYIVISLCIAIYTYHDWVYSRMAGGNINDCYQNSAKSLRFGFLYIPSFIVVAAIMMYVMMGVRTMILWMATNLP